MIQTAGRAARHLNGEVILYADIMTQSIQKFLAVSDYRRKKQIAYNQEHNITPRSVSRAVEESLSAHRDSSEQAQAFLKESGVDIDITETIKELEEEMLGAANNLEFEKAALLRDQIRELKRTLDNSQPVPAGSKSVHLKPVSYKSGNSRGRGKSKGNRGSRVSEPF